MKLVKSFLLIILVSVIGICNSYAQSGKSFEGIWLGTLKVNEDISFRMAFDIKAGDNCYTATLNSIDQAAFGIPVDSVSISDNDIFLKVNSINCEFKGALCGADGIKGDFVQGASFPMTLKRVDVMPGLVKRPQEPKKPYGYVEEIVEFDNKDAGVTIAGTLTKPSVDGKFPAVVLISGSGPNGRDAHIFGHKVFLVLSDYLTRQGFAVLRVDDRGAGLSTGDFGSASVIDLADDVVAGVKYLKGRSDIIENQVGLIGHSLGGDIAPIAAVKMPEIDFIVLMSGSGMSLEQTIYMQCEAGYSAMGISREGIDLNRRINEKVISIVRDERDVELAKKRIAEQLKLFNPEVSKLSEKEQKILELKTPLNPKAFYEFLSPAMRIDLFEDPCKYLQRVKCPVLAINGGKDLQVLPVNLDLIKKALRKGKNRKTTIKLFPNKNHLFQTCKTGEVSEYSRIEETMSPDVQMFVSDWLRKTISGL